MRNIFLLLLALVLVPLTVSCTADNQPLRFSSTVWPGYEPIYLARELGYLPPENVQLVELTTSTWVIEAFRNGLVDAGGFTIDETITLLNEGQEPVIILVVDISNGGDAIISKPHINRFSDLKGKTIGVENAAMGGYFLSRALDYHKMTESDIRIVPIESHDHEKTFLTNKLDAIVTYEPYRSLILRNNSKVIFDSSKVPNTIIDLFVVRKSVMERHKNNIKKLVNAWFSALEYMAANREHANTIMNWRLKLKESELNTAMAGLRYPDRQENIALLSAQISGISSSISAISEYMLSKNLLSGRVDATSLYPPTWIFQQ